MENDSELLPENMEALSFDKLLSISKLLRECTRFGKFCCLKEISTDTDKDIFKYPVRINAYILVICSNGLIELTCNLFHGTLSSNSLFLYNPGTIVRINTIQPSRMHLMIFTQEFIDELGIKFENIPLQHKIVRQQQFFTLSSESCREISLLMSISENLIRCDKANLYYPEMVRASLKSLIYRILYETTDQYKNSLTAGKLPIQDNSHFDRFMRLLQDNYMKHHSIRFYSDKMGLSPKYLSLVIKKASGRLATEWIDEYVILEAKNLIKYSPMSIQEIAYALNFSNQSFFGKYFKRHTGLSPKAYRIQQ
ncbi:MAG: AraC family transcriptional regulator [Muribaculum sp.]|nr:AraC family transcriptional regulator [Muribaculum sp.]